MSELPENAVELYRVLSVTYRDAADVAENTYGPGRAVWIKDDPPPEPTLAAKINNKFPPPSGYRWQHVIDEFGLVDRGEYQLYADRTKLIESLKHVLAVAEARADRLADQRDRMVDERNAARMDQALAITKLAEATNG